MHTAVDKVCLAFKRLPGFNNAHKMLLWAGLAGFIGALATICFKEGLAFLQWVLVGHSGSMVEMAKQLPRWWRLVLPCLGGLVAGCFLVVAQRYTRDSKADYMEAIALGDGKISVRQTALRSISSLCTIASGGSIGREGAMIQLAATCASVLGSVTRLQTGQLRMLVACGAAAGITAAYNAPIASAFFIAEIVLGTMAMESIGPIMVAAVTANITMRDFPGYKPTYEMPAFPTVTNLEVFLFVGLGVLTGLAAPQFLRFLTLAKRGFQKTNLPLPLRLGLGGLMVGMISVMVPQVWGNGYSVVNSMLHQPWLWTTVLMLLVCKIVATACTAGSGAIGGVFTPTIFVGAAMGLLFGQSMQALLPHMASEPFAYAIVGMGAFLAAATSAPLMAMLMIFEMTMSYQIMLPLMLACVVSYFVARQGAGAYMYEVTHKRNLDALERARLAQTQMRDLIQPALTVLPPDAGFQQMMDMFAQHPVKYLYIVDAQMHYLGTVALRDLTAVRPDVTLADHVQARDFVKTDAIPLITAEMPLGDALQHFLVHRGERLPVVRSEQDPTLLGAVFKTAVLDAYVRLQKVDTLQV